MTPPMTPREKVGYWLSMAMDAGLHKQDFNLSEATDAILTALASGSGDHGELARLAEEASSGPWSVDADDIGRTIVASPVEIVARDTRHNSAFIAAANPATVLALLAENAALRSERDDADRRAGAAERELEGKTDSISKRERWLRNAKEARGYHQNISFDRVWAETCAAADRATEAERKLAEAVGLLREWSSRDPKIPGLGLLRLQQRAEQFLSKEAERGCS